MSNRSLSPKALLILALAMEGLTDREIAARLGLSPETIGTHWRRILRALSARNRTHATAIVLSERFTCAYRRVLNQAESASDIRYVFALELAGLYPLYLRAYQSGHLPRTRGIVAKMQTLYQETLGPVDSLIADRKALKSQILSEPRSWRDIESVVCRLFERCTVGDDDLQHIAAETVPSTDEFQVSEDR